MRSAATILHDLRRPFSYCFTSNWTLLAQNTHEKNAKIRYHYQPVDLMECEKVFWHKTLH